MIRNPNWRKEQAISSPPLSPGRGPLTRPLGQPQPHRLPPPIPPHQLLQHQAFIHRNNKPGRSPELNNRKQQAAEPVLRPGDPAVVGTSREGEGEEVEWEDEELDEVDEEAGGEEEGVEEGWAESASCQSARRAVADWESVERRRWRDWAPLARI